MSTTNPIEVDVDLTLGDFYKANLGMSLYFLRYLIGAVAMAAVLWAICLAVSFSRYAWSDNADSLAQWLFPVVAGCCSNGTHLGADGPAYPRKADASRRKWEAFRQVRETRQYFLLYAAPGFANVVPKRCFPSDTSIAEFRSLVRGRVRKFKLRS